MKQSHLIPLLALVACSGIGALELSASPQDFVPGTPACKKKEKSVPCTDIGCADGGVNHNKCVNGDAFLTCDTTADPITCTNGTSCKQEKGSGTDCD